MDRCHLQSAMLGVLCALSLLLAPAPAAAVGGPVERARVALALSNYPLARKELAAIKGAHGADALLLETRLQLWTGRYAAAVATAQRAARLGRAARAAVAPWWAEALRRQGKLAAAIKLLKDAATDAKAHRVHLLLGELLIGEGKRREAEPWLMQIINAYNNDEITSTDGEGLSLVGHAAHLLRAYRDANDAFNQAEDAGAKRRVEALLWRAELFLEKYDPGHAAQVVGEAAKLAANDPRVLVAVARVKLAQTLDFSAAERAIDKALTIDPHLAEAYFVRAGLALRDMDIDRAMAATEAGLKRNPTDLDLLSMRAATRFLAEDRPGFDELRKRVLTLNPQFSSFYTIVGEFAEWEHRYDEIVRMMREAVKVDPLDGKAHAALGLNLIRAGDERAGLDELRRAWRRDKYNVRVYNTLNLYDNTIVKDYVTVDGARFRIRYNKHERRILERYVPRMLDRAWASMVKRYGFSPQTPVGIELYADSQQFSVRTSGLPNVGIQGVCFGKTLAALSPGAGSFNWGMILWHELAHVFHIQLSKSRVPRWFTEGLAEYETIIERPEWRREEHLALYRGLRDHRIPKLVSFNRAFTHVDHPSDVTMAYFAASQVAVFMAHDLGFAKVVALLRGWGEGKRTAELIERVAGMSADQLDARFRRWLGLRLARYRRQFVPNLRPPRSVDEARKAVVDDPRNAAKHVKLALALLGDGKRVEAVSTLKLALRIDPNELNAQYLELRLAMRGKDLDEAGRLAARLIKHGGDGYAARMKAADIAEAKHDIDGMRKQLAAAHRFDPSQAEPLQALFDLAVKEKDSRSQLGALRQLAKLDQHDRRVWGRLLRMLVKRGYWQEARAVGESSIYVDVANPRIHWDYARALARTGRQISAIRELNSAVIAHAQPADAVAIYRSMAEGYRKLGKPKYAARAKRYADQMAALAGAKTPSVNAGSKTSSRARGAALAPPGASQHQQAIPGSSTATGPQVGLVR